MLYDKSQLYRRYNKYTQHGKNNTLQNETKLVEMKVRYI